MHLIRFLAPGATTASVGVLDGDTITAVAGLAGIGHALRLPLGELRDRCEQTSGSPLPAADVRMLPPVDRRMEVWAAGVTYTSSKLARMAESERAASVYEQVYGAPRPELFFKSAAWRVVGDGEPVAIRDDSAVNVPEPELAAVVNAGGEIVGYLVCDDVSSRSIEGENPLYLPQAKVYLGSCAVSAGIRPVWEVPDPYALGIELTIERGGTVAWHDRTNTSQLRRRLPDLLSYLRHADAFPDGAVLSTGTCLVPPLPFTLAAGDIVTIEIEEVGVLRNPVVQGLDAMRWLVDREFQVPV